MIFFMNSDRPWNRLVEIRLKSSTAFGLPLAMAVRVNNQPELRSCLESVSRMVQHAPVVKPQGLKPDVFLAFFGTLRLRSGQAIEVVP
jgi:hypothetical protein